MILCLFSFISLKAKVNSIGVTQLLINEPSVIDITLEQSNLSTYIYFSNNPPNSTYVSRKRSGKMYLRDIYMFISNEDVNLNIGNPIVNPINLTIWIIPTEICSNSARIFKTNQAIFSHWVFTKELKKMCYFPINNDQANADITLLATKKLPIKSYLTIYTSSEAGSLNIVQNLTESKKVGPFNTPFFISLENARSGTIFAYKIHFSNVIEDVCIDEPFKYLNQSNASFDSLFSSVDAPSFACSNDHDNFIIKLMFIGICVIAVLALIVLVFLMMRASIHNKKIRHAA